MTAPAPHPAPDLIFPHPVPPAPGSLTEIVPGVLWLRLALPFQLDHVNIYLIADGDGWAVLDTGIADAPTRAVWEGLLADGLDGRPLTRLIVTHFHPDHLGLAGWMSEALGLPLYMSQVEYLTAQNLQHNPDAQGSATHRGFYRRHGMAPDVIETVLGRGHAYLKMTTGLAPSYTRLAAGGSITIGRRRFEILTGGGHAPEQVMLYCRAEALFFAADQVLAKISPNIGVWPWEPAADPLAAYLSSLAALRRDIPDDVLVLPAHNLPFRGLHARVRALEDHHALRCAEIAAACAEAPRTASEILPALFKRELDAHQTGFAFGEVLAHINLMLGRGTLVAAPSLDGVVRVRGVPTGAR